MWYLFMISICIFKRNTKEKIMGDLFSSGISSSELEDPSRDRDAVPVATITRLSGKVVLLESQN